MNKIEYFLDELESCEEIGEFRDEYVYDIEVDDNTHTFIGNDILVHNSLFVSFKPALDHCEWRNNILNREYLDSMESEFIIFSNESDHSNKVIGNHDKNDLEYNKPYVGFDFLTRIGCQHIHKKEIFKGLFDSLLDPDIKKLEKIFYNYPNIKILADGCWINNKDFFEMFKDKKVIWNWSSELDFIHALDKYRYAGFFKKSLEEYALKFGVSNKEDFELERISESIINIAKKKYIQHIVYEDGIPYDRFNYIYPKGVELVRSSTPAFARDKIVNIVKYLFSHPDDFNIKELLKLVRSLKKEFDLCVPDKIDDIAMQSSCSNYESKVLDDKIKLSFVTGAHFAVKASAYHNFLLHKNKSLQEKYELIKSGSKIKYYYCKDTSVNDIFAYVRGSYPIEIAPDIDLDVQFEKSILSPINSIIAPLGLPEITKRLSVVVDIWGKGF